MTPTEMLERDLAQVREELARTERILAGTRRALVWWMRLALNHGWR